VSHLEIRPCDVVLKWMNELTPKWCRYCSEHWVQSKSWSSGYFYSSLGLKKKVKTPNVQEEVVYLEGRVNSAYSQLTDAETKLKDLKESDKSSMGEIEDKNRELRRKYDRYYPHHISSIPIPSVSFLHNHLPRR